MLDGLKVRFLPVLALLTAGYLLISPSPADAQVAQDANKWAELDVTNAINRAIEENNGGDELREKLVRRFSECSLMYGGLSTLATTADAKKNYVQAQLATMEIEATIAKPLQSAKRLELEQAAQVSVAVMLRAVKAQGDKVKAQGDKELGPLLKNC